MGRATRWFKSLLGFKKHHHHPEKEINQNGRREKMGQKEETERENQWLRNYIADTEDEQSKHAIAVASAAMAAAQAAVAVVRLTAHGRDALSSRGGQRKGRERLAAVKIQTFFRGFLARKALRALKALVKLQAHVRGYLVRKRAAATLHSMQALVRAQATVRSRRANQKNTKLQSEFQPRRSIERLEETRSELGHSKRISTSYHEANNANEGNPKIVQVDTYKPRTRRINPSLYDFTNEDFLQYPTMSSPLPSPALARLSVPNPRDIHRHDYYSQFYGDEYRISTAQSTPRFANSGPLTPTKSVCGESVFGPNHPNYMADTHSFRAKLRAQSVPKQRPDAVRMRKKLSLHEIMAARNSISSVRMHRSCPQVQDTSNL